MKLYMLFKVRPQGKVGYKALLEKVLRCVHKTGLALATTTPDVAMTACDQEVGTGTTEGKIVVAQRVRKLTVGDLENFLEWFCNGACACVYARHGLQGVVAVVGVGGAFEFIDDEAVWKEEYDNLISLAEEAILDKNRIKIKSFINNMCFECIPYSTDSKTLLTLSEKLSTVLVIMCSLAHSQLDLRAGVELVIKCSVMIFETCKFLKGQHDEIVRRFVDTVMNRLIVPKLERILTVNKKELGGERLYLESMRLCQALKKGKQAIQDKEICAFIDLCP